MRIRLLLLLCLPPLVLLPTKCLCSGFIANHGQWDERVLYYLDGPNYGIFFTRHGFVFDIHEALTPSDRKLDYENSLDVADLTPGKHRKGAAIFVRFQDAGIPLDVEAERITNTRYNYILGNDPEKWRTGVPSYNEIVYKGLLGGDLVFRVEGSTLSYSVTPAKEKGISVPRFMYEGAEEVFEENDGAMSLITNCGMTVHHRQLTNDQSGFFYIPPTVPPNSGNWLNQRDELEALTWSTVVGAGNWEIGKGIAVDPAGDVVVVGWSGSIGFPTTPGCYDDSLEAPESDAVVFKMDSDGSNLIWSTFLGGGGYEEGMALSLDEYGNPVITGVTYSTNFPTTPGAYSDTYSDLGDAFVSKLDVTGSDLLLSSYIGGSDLDWSQSVDHDQFGNLLICGYTKSLDFPTTPGAYDESFNGDPDDVFVTKLDSQGPNLIWSTFLGGDTREYGYALSLTGNDEVVVTGLTYSTDYPTTPNAFDTTHSGASDIFVSRLSPTGSDLEWSTFLGGGGYESGNAVIVDIHNSVFITGQTSSDDYPTTPGAYDETRSYYEDAFITKLHPSGSSIEWSTFVGGSGRDYGRSIAINDHGDVLFAGLTESTNFPVEGPGCDQSANGYQDAFLTKISATGDAALWSSYIGGVMDDKAYGVALDSAQNIILVGATYSSDFPTTNGVYDETFNGDFDIFVSSINTDIQTGISYLHDAPHLPISINATPNPFNPSTTLRLTLQEPLWAHISVYDIRGRLISVLHDGYLMEGGYEFLWNGRDVEGRSVGSGVYSARLIAGETISRSKLVLVR